MKIGLSHTVLFLLKMIKRISLLVFNSFYDFSVFFKHSGVFSDNTKGKVLGKIIYYYHSIEKGLLNDNIRLRFGRKKVPILVKELKKWIDNNYGRNNSQFVAGCSVLCKYYELHLKMNTDISDIVSGSDYKQLKKYSKENIGGVISCDSKSFFIDATSSFKDFSNSRRSIRHFNGSLISVEEVEKVIKLASNAPSVCNRQTAKVHLINKIDTVKEVLKIQRGMNASAETVKQVLIITSDLGGFVSEVERNQMYVDGGIFLQNLLYALHYYKIGACALNWSKPFFFDRQLRRVTGISKSLTIIAVVAIGYPNEKFKVPCSVRKKTVELLDVIE